MMSKPAIHLRRWAAGAAIAAALAFGGAQALAAPAAAEPQQDTCSRVCDRLCRSIGAFGGFCPRPGNCVCYIR